MLNLVQVQEKLKDMPTQAVMSYANGSNPAIPPFVALGELNRRKRIEDSAMAEQAKGDQPSVKEQVEQQLGIMQLQNQRQAQGAQQMAGIMANSPQPGATGQSNNAPVQMADGGRPVDKMSMLKAMLAGQQRQPQQRPNPEALKKLMMLKAMKESAGISGLPMRRDMMQRKDFAGGGIVAFEEGGSTSKEERDFDQATALFEAERAARLAEDKVNRNAGPSDIKAGSNELLKKMIGQASQATSLEDLAAEQKRAKELAGVKENPYEQSRKELDALRAARAKYAEGQNGRELREFLLGVASAKPMSGLGVALGGGSERMAKEEERFRALEDQQKTQELQWMRADEKERDAINRGDAKAMLEAKAEKDKLNYNILKLSQDKESLAYQRFMTAVNGDPYLRQLEERRKKAYVEPGSPEDLEFDRMMNARKEQLAKEAGYDYRTVPYVNPVTPKPKEEKKGLFSGFGKKSEEKEAAPKAKVDTGIPPGLPKGTTVYGRTPEGDVVYLTPDGKKLVQK